MYKLKSLQEHSNHLDTLDTVDQIKNREKCIHSILESLDNQTDYNTVDQIMVNELFGIGKLLKRVFVNPGVRRKIRKLVDELVSVRVEMIKTQLDENPDYVESVINDEEKTRKAYDVKVETLQQQQEAIEQKMDALAGGDERLEKYVNLQKIEARMKTNKLIIKVADKTTKKLLKDYDKEAGKEAKELADDLMESLKNPKNLSETAPRGTTFIYESFKAFNESLVTQSERDWLTYIDEMGHMIQNNLSVFVEGARHFGFPDVAIQDAIASTLSISLEEALNRMDAVKESKGSDDDFEYCGYHCKMHKDKHGYRPSVYKGEMYVYGYEQGMSMSLGQAVAWAKEAVDTIKLDEKVEFQDLYKSKNRWLQAYKKGDRDEIIENMYVLIGNSYAPLSGHSGVEDMDGMFDERVTYWEAADMDLDPDMDTVIFGRKTKFGIKILGLGHDGLQSDRTALIEKLHKLLMRPGYWTEQCEEVEAILYKMSTPYVDNEDECYVMWPDAKWLDDEGRYDREQDGSWQEKTTFGRPLLRGK